MIIEYDFANDLLEEIEFELNQYDKQYGIKLTDISFSKHANYEWMYKTLAYSLPIFSCGSTNIIQLNKGYYEILVNNWVKEHPTLVKNGVDNTIQVKMKNGYPEETIHSAICDKIFKLVDEYDSVLKVSKKSNRLFGIEDEEKVLLIHLNKYIETINSDTEQIKILHGITLNKKITDLVLEIYIRFIHARLKMLKPEFPEISRNKEQDLTKILWKGSQKDLCELFVELQNNKWIDEFKWGERQKYANSICNLFDLTLTKKSENSNPESSFYQILKGSYNPKTKERCYEEVLGKESERKFSKIKRNGS